MTVAAPPRWLSVEPANLPRKLVDDHSWYPGLITPRKNKPGKWNKQPADPETAELAKWSNPATRCTFDQAYMAYQRNPRFKCIGYMMDTDAGVIGIDLDTCIAPDGAIAPWAQEIVDRFPGAYWERSISNTGLRGFCRGTLPVGGCRSKIEKCSVELYADVRFLVVTGQALAYVETLPTLQEAVDALHGRLTAGRARATGTAVKTGLTGHITNSTPDELAILEDVMGGRWSATMSEIWARDELDAAGASEEDWTLEKEIAYWAIRRGLEGDVLALTVERIMRAGPYRSKWDEARGAVSWLAQDVANAVKTTQDRLKKAEANGPTVVWDDDPEATSEQPAAAETLEQKVVRLERENRQLRATNAVQMTVINAERAGKEAAVETVRGISNILAQPKEHMTDDFKVFTIQTILEAHSRASRGIAKLPSIRLEERTGQKKNKISDHIQDLAARAGSPIRREKTREWRTNEVGIQEPITVSLVRPLHATVTESLAAVLTMGGPSTKAEQKRQQDRERAAKARGEWGHCPSCDNDTVIVTGKCPAHGKIVGETIVRREDFQILNPEIRESSPRPTATVDVRTKGHELRESAAQLILASDPRASVFSTDPDGPHTVHVDVGAPDEPIPFPIRAASRPQERPDRCPAPGCATLGFRMLPDGSWRCLKSNHDPRTYRPFSPSAEWQEIPDGYPCPPGGEFRMDFQTGTNWGRWRELAQAIAGAEE